MERDFRDMKLCEIGGGSALTARDQHEPAWFVAGSSEVQRMVIATISGGPPMVVPLAFLALLSKILVGGQASAVVRFTSETQAEIITQADT